MLSLSLSIEAGDLWHKKFGLWLPDGLHIWVNRWGVHLFWSSASGKRVVFDRVPKDRS